MNIDGTFTLTNSDTSGNGVDLNGKSLTITGNAAINGGKLTAGASSITPLANWTVSGATFVAGTSTFNFQSTTTFTPGGQAINNVSLGSAGSPLAYWKFDDGSGTSAVDSSGNGYTATLSASAPSWVTGHIGPYALSFNGTNNYLSIPAASYNNLSTGTIALWVNLTSNTGEVVICKQHDGVNSIGVLAIGQNIASGGGPIAGGTSGKLYFHSRNSQTLGVSTGTVATGAWHHIAVTFNASQAIFYIDGSQDSTISGNFTIPSDLSPTSTSIGFWGPGLSSNYFSGKMDDFHIYNQVLTSTQISNLYNSGFISSGTATLSGGPLTVGGNFNLGIGTFNSNGQDVAVAGNWTNTAATFTQGTRTVTFNGTGSQTVTSNSGTFYNMTVTNASAGGVSFADAWTATNFTDNTASSTLKFLPSTTYTITGALNINGNSTLTQVVIDTTTGATPKFTFSVPSRQEIFYADIRRAQASGAQILALYSKLTNTDYGLDSQDFQPESDTNFFGNMF